MKRKTTPRKGWCKECKNYNHQHCKKFKPKSKNKKCSCWCTKYSRHYLLTIKRSKE